MSRCRAARHDAIAIFATPRLFYEPSTSTRRCFLRACYDAIICHYATPFIDIVALLHAFDVYHASRHAARHITATAFTAIALPRFIFTFVATTCRHMLYADRQRGC